MIEVRNATLIRGGKKLLEDISFKIGDHQNYGITGNNGSGKTLLMEVLAGGAHLAAGEVYYSFIQDGTWDERHRQKQKNIKYIPTHALQSIIGGQSSHYYQERYYSDEDNDIDDVASFLGATKDELDALDLPASLSITALLKIRITRLSNGQLRKMLLVKALLGNIPKMLLLDYPFEGLDQESRADLSSFVNALTLQYGIQIIMTDQHHYFPSSITRKLVMNNFKIVSDEPIHIDLARKAAAPMASTGTRSAREPIIQIRNLGIRYGTKQILENFSWTVTRGERWALIGQNGSGKTTLFSMIFADHPMAYTQEIFLFGKRRGTGESIWDIKNRIGYLGPEIISFLNPKSISRTARDHVRGQTDCDSEVLDITINYFGAPAFFDLPVLSLSSGQLQLMEIIRCFVSKKELLLLDEPFQFLDAKNQEMLRGYLRERLDTKTTLILITHEERDVAEWAEKIIRL